MYIVNELLTGSSDSFTGSHSVNIICNDRMSDSNNDSISDNDNDSMSDSMSRIIMALRSLNFTVPSLAE